MDKVIEIWNGEWWLPNNLGASNSVGRLIYYEDKNPELEITVMSTANAFLWPDKRYPVIYGTDAQGNEFHYSMQIYDLKRIFQNMYLV